MGLLRRRLRGKHEKEIVIELDKERERALPAFFCHGRK